MRVAIFGGTGFVGAYLVDALIEAGTSSLSQCRPFIKASRPRSSVMTRSSVRRLLGTVVLALISCASAAEIVEPDGVEARQLDKCAGCSAMVDQVYQRILAAVPNDTRLRVDESTAAMMFERF